MWDHAETTGVVFSLQDTVDHVTFAGQALRYTPFACRELAEQRFIADRCSCMAGELLSTPDLRASHPFCYKVSENISNTIERFVSTYKCNHRN